MSDEAKGETISAQLQRPRSPRVPAAFEVKLSGQTTAGVPFSVSARTIKISYRGATIATDIDVQPGAVLKLVPSFWHALEAEVTGVWTNEPDGRQYVGLKLLHPHGWFAEADF